MKQFEPKDVTVLGHQFHIFPFGAFKAANLSGEIAALIGPMLGGLASLLGADNGSNLMDIDAEKAAPAIAGAFDSISGDKVESLLKKLLVQNKNISVEYDGDTVYLSEDLANEIFCMEAQGLYILAFEVIRCNFGGFFGKLGTLFGSAKMQAAAAESIGTGI